MAKRKQTKKKEERRKGPRLPNSLKRELESLNPKNVNSSDEEEGGSEDEFNSNDVYEYEAEVPEEESKKNRRYDSVDNLEYQLPDEFEDENVSSDDDDEEEDNDDRQARMLQGTGIPVDAFEGKKRKLSVVSETYPESEYNPSRGALGGDGLISVKDLLDPLQQMRGYNEIRKRMRKLDTESMSVPAPLPKLDQEKLERRVAYESSKKDLSKFGPQVKRNREAQTIFFDEDIDVGFSTVGAIASEFQPRTDFEKKIGSLVHDAKIVEAHREDGERLLELNKISVEDVKDRQNRLAKMRSLLFRHEMKSKHIKKIKSKAFHRGLKKDKMKAASAGMQTDPEAAKEQAMKQEFKRAEERMRLKHKNTSKWAKRILKRGLEAQDEGTRVAITEQLHQHALLTRKMNSMKDSTSSDDSSDEDDDGELSPGIEHDGASKLLNIAREKTIKIMEEEDEMPTSGVLSLPFMVRGLKKRKDEAYEEAKLAVEEYDSSLKQLEDTKGTGTPKVSTSSGRRVFGAARKQSEESSNRVELDNVDRDSESEDECKAKDNIDVECAKNGTLLKEVHVNAAMFDGDSDIVHDSMFKSFDDTIRDPGPKTTYEVSIFASNSWKKMGSKNGTNGKDRKSQVVAKPALPNRDLKLKEIDEDGGTESEEEMVDGILSHSTKPNYELPSQEDLIRRAFAGDDVEEEFEKDKEEVLDEENPEPEKPVLVPGWGQWTHIQKKKGMPSWMLEEHEIARKKREDSLKKRKDAHLKHVIISEKINKKAEKLHTKTLPFPFTSKEVFEQSIRVPIGPEFNPATSVGALIRPEVVKKPGVIIKPIKLEEINPYEKENDHKSKGQNQKTKINNTSSRKATKRLKAK
ncbi:hypothetical protein IFM89_025761 [Coptis chinensis]|uniref:U3 small nucleolar RNA-associated protein 14 n=1 Tax=Coptis chinensis TaxID=261450 RepID=A0A835HXG8_9MAGN|nr:hypothetical protein IFM89_025761 [Coptis chinensis]